MNGLSGFSYHHFGTMSFIDTSEPRDVSALRNYGMQDFFIDQHLGTMIFLGTLGLSQRVHHDSWHAHETLGKMITFDYRHFGIKHRITLDISGGVRRHKVLRTRNAGP